MSSPATVLYRWIRTGEYPPFEWMTEFAGDGTLDAAWEAESRAAESRPVSMISTLGMLGRWDDVVTAWRAWLGRARFPQMGNNIAAAVDRLALLERLSLFDLEAHRKQVNMRVIELVAMTLDDYEHGRGAEEARAVERAGAAAIADAVAPPSIADIVAAIARRADRA